MASPPPPPGELDLFRLRDDARAVLIDFLDAVRVKAVRRKQACTQLPRPAPSTLSQPFPHRPPSNLSHPLSSLPARRR
jgi:hypothetical protein